MNDGPPPITSFGELGVLVWHLQQQLSTQSKQIGLFQSTMATHDDMKAVREVIATLVTRAALDVELKTIRDEMSRTKPSTIIGDLARLCAGLTVIGAFVAGIVALLGPFLKIAGA